MIRRYFLQNSIGERRGMNDEKILLTEPKGNGYERENKYADIGSGFFIRIDDRYDKQIPVTGRIIFTENPYEKYREFINWINQSYDMMLVYIPFGREEYYRDIDVTKIEKEELTTAGILEIPIALHPKTPWYKIRPRTETIETSTDGMTIFTFRYGARYARTNIPFSEEVAGEGHIASGISVEIEGRIYNPAIVLTDIVTGAEYGRCEVADTVEEGERLEYYSNQTKTGIYLTAGDGTKKDMIDSIDISPKTFFTIPLNRVCRLTVTGEETDGAVARRSIYDYYRSV